MKKIFLLFKSALFWIIFIAIFCILLNILINLLISYIWNYIINKFFPSSLSFLKYLLILILFSYNYFLLRSIVISWIFEWQHPFQFFSIYKERQTYLNYLKTILNDFVIAIDAILKDFNSLSKIQFEFFDSFFYLFEEEYNIYHDLYIKTTSNENGNNNNLIRYKMSKCQIKYYNLLSSIKTRLNSNNLKNILLTKYKNKDNVKDNKEINGNVQENINNIRQLKLLLNEFQNIIEKYDKSNYTYMSPFYLFNLFFNDTFGSLSLYSLQFKKNFEKYQIDEDFTPNGKIHYSLIRNKNNINNDNINDNTNSNTNDNNINLDNNKDDGVLMIFCLPNATLYELIPKGKIEFYLNNGFSFLGFNYNGYGYSKGSPNFKNLKKNILELYDFIVHNTKYNFRKICVMGHSIGGIPAIYLAKNRHVDLLISDRNFCDINRLANNLYFGRILKFLLKNMFIGDTDNIQNFCDFNSYKTYKIIIYSPVDSLIYNDASIKSGISRYIIKNYIVYKNSENMNNVMKDKENLLDIVFNKYEKESFMDKFLEIAHLYYDNKDDINYYNNEYYNYNEENLIDNIMDNGNKDIEQILDKLFSIFLGSCDDLYILIKKNISKRREKIFIDNYFNNLLIWGIQKPKEDENLEFYSYKGKQALKDAYNLLNKNTNNKNQIKDNKTPLLLTNLKDNFKKIVNVIDNLEITLNSNININNNVNIIDDDENIKERLISSDSEEIRTNIDNNNNINKDMNLNKKNDFYNKLNNITGNIKLLKSYSGHNRGLSEEELQLFYMFLLSSGIIR